MYRDFQQNTISLKLWDGEGWQWCRLRLRGNTVPEEGQMMSPALVLKKDRAELHIPWKIPVADGRGARERITAESKICSAVFTGQDACTVCCILDSSGKRESSFYIKGGREYANASRQIYDRIKRSEDVQGGGGNAKANYRYWKKLKNLHEHYAHQISRQIINYCKIQNASILVLPEYNKDYGNIILASVGKIPHFDSFRPFGRSSSTRHGRKASSFWRFNSIISILCAVSVEPKFAEKEPTSSVSTATAAADI